MYSIHKPCCQGPSFEYLDGLSTIPKSTHIIATEHNVLFLVASLPTSFFSFSLLLLPVQASLLFSLLHPCFSSFPTATARVHMASFIVRRLPASHSNLDGQDHQSPIASDFGMQTQIATLFAILMYRTVELRIAKQARLESQLQLQGYLGPQSARF